MDKFTPDDMQGFGNAAIQPYLKLTTFMHRETWSSAKTDLFIRSLESQDKNWACGLMCLKFRNGVMAFKAELWQCYEGEGLKGLDEKWDVGTAIFPNGVDESVMVDILSYVGESERVLAEKTELFDRLKVMEAAFEKYVKKHEKAFAPPQEESAVAAVKAMLEA